MGKTNVYWDVLNNENRGTLGGRATSQRSYRLPRGTMCYRMNIAGSTFKSGSMATSSDSQPPSQSTRLQAVQDQLRAIDERLELASQSAGVGTWDWNIGEDDIVMDEQLHKLFGLQRGEFDGKLESFFQLLHPDDVASVSAKVAATVEQGVDYDADYRVIWPNQEIHYIRAKGRVYLDEKGAPLRMTGVCWEVTAEVLAVQLQARLASIVETSEDAIISCDLDDEIVTWNASAERMFKYTREEAVGLPISIIFPDDRMVEFETLLDGIHRNESVRPIRNIHIRRDKMKMDISIAMSPIVDEHGHVFGASVIARDVTPLVNAEKKLKASLARIQQTNEELQQFAYAASHDLREPLRTVRSFCELLQKKYKHQIDEEADRWIEFMSDATIRMQQLIEDLLQYSRLESNAQPPSDTDFRRAVDEAVLNLKLAIDESGATIHCQDLPTLKAERSQIVQLFQNLIANAIRYRSAEPPQISISAKQVKQEWQFSVSDNGIGIDPKFHEKVFEMFQRLHARDKYGGTGIGLAFCRKIVNRHGGRIWMESPPRGTIVHFTVPVSK